MTNFRKKISRILLFLFSGLILIAIAASVFFYFEAQSYLNKNLSEFVEKKSKGKYELSFDNLEINFSKWGFQINQISFHPSDSILKIIDQTETTKQIYSFSSKNIQFSGISLIKLIFREKLEIGEILITQPELIIHGKKSETVDQQENISSLLKELKPLVTKNFKSIKIKKIELANASFDFYNLLGDTRKLSNAENVTIGIQNFYTDSLILSDQKHLFDADDIYLRMQHYQNKLADSIHVINAEFVTYSLKRSVIEAQNIELKPINQAITAKSQYYIFVPKAKITTRHINEFYRNNAIPIDSLILSNPTIKYWPGQKKIKFKLDAIEDFDLYDLIKDEFSSISIQNFKLNKANINLFKMQNDNSSQQEFKDVSINLENFLLDSVSLQDTSRIFYSRSIDLSASDYELTLGDNIHRVKVGNLDLSTRDKSIQVKDILIFPLNTKSNLKNENNTIDAKCDSIRLDLFNFKKAFHQKRFVFQRVNIFNPEVKIIQNETSVEKSEPENPSFIYRLISSYVKGIYSDYVLVEKGKLQIVNKTGVIQRGNIESNIKLRLSGFALDEVSAKRTDRLFFANQIELNFSNYQMQLVDQLHKLTIGNLSISTQKKEAKLQNLHLYPVSISNMDSLLKQYNRSELYEFTIPELSLSNANFHEAFFNKNLSVDTLSINNSKIYFENFEQLKQSKPNAGFEDLFHLLSDYLYDIRIGTVLIPDGTIRLINHSKKDKTISLNNQFSLKLENLLINKDQFDQDKLLYSQYVEFTVRDHIIRFSDNVHVLKAGEVGFSTRRNEIFVLNARIYPETNSKEFSAINWNIQLAIPEIRIKGIDIEEFYFNHKINAENLSIKSPDIKLYQKRKRTDVKEIKEVSFPLPKEIESIAIKKFTLTDGSLKVFSEMGIRPYLMVQSDLKMAAQNILIQKDRNADKPMFKSGEYTGNLIQFKFTPQNKNQQFGIEELSFSTVDHRILAKNLVVKPKTKSIRNDQFILQIPSLAMNGFDIDNAYRNDQFFFESIIVEKPSFQLFNNAKDSTRFNPFTLNLYPHFESFADVFSSKSMNIKDADIQVFKNGNKRLQQKLSLNLSKIRIDSRPSQGFMHAADFSFNIPNLKKQTKLYQYNIGVTSYSSVNNRLTAKNITIVPVFDKEKFQKQIPFQADYYSGKIDSINIAQPNVRRWFEKEELAGKYLSVNGLHMDIFRDKQTPFNENQRPEMLQNMIKSIKYPILVDSLILDHSNISYTEKTESGDSEGTIRFSDIHTRLMPFTNIKNAKGVFPDFKLDGATTIMDSTQLHISMNYMMNNPDNLFTAKGYLNKFNMPILNPVLEPLAMVSLRSGKVDRFDFSFTADNNKSIGELFFGYDDLKISVLEMKDGNTKEAKIASFLANSLLLKSKNPRGKEFLPEEINFERDQKRSILNYWWKSIFSGIRNTLGIKDKKQDEQE